jgi:hypothetical protein
MGRVARSHIPAILSLCRSVPAAPRATPALEPNFTQCLYQFVSSTRIANASNAKAPLAATSRPSFETGAAQIRQSTVDLAQTKKHFSAVAHSIGRSPFLTKIRQITVEKQSRMLAHLFDSGYQAETVAGNAIQLLPALFMVNSTTYYGAKPAAKNATNPTAEMLKTR